MSGPLGRQLDRGLALTRSRAQVWPGVIVEENRRNPARLVRTTYAAGVGPVSIEYLVHEPTTGRFDTALRASLRGVTRPGQDPLQ